MTTERPILFSAPMVRALMAGQKTQTRRPLRVQPPANTVQVSTYHHPDPRPMFWAWTRDGDPMPDHPLGGAEISEWLPMPSPYGQPGDKLWVREAWRTSPLFNDKPPRDLPDFAPLRYEADNALRGGWAGYGLASMGKLRPGMFMPRWASRITLEVVSVRVERLQDISEADAAAEGITKPAGSQFWHGDPRGSSLPGETPQWAYRNLWESINGPGAWDANPWVWAVLFQVVAR